jgi:uncharacterized protein (DUF2141 family)
MVSARPRLPSRVPSALGLGVAALGLGGALSASPDEPRTADDSAGNAATAALTVRVGHLRNDRGRVAVALFASAKDFPEQRRALAGRLTRIRSGHASVHFDGLVPGVYAVAVLHDENENDEMDFNFLGMPREGYGFSNDASAPFGPPSFAAAAFTLRPRPSFIAIETRYFL